MTDQSKKLIYLAEDDEVNGALLKESLEQAGYRVEHVVNGVQLLDLFVSGTPDLVLLDLVMPVKTGYEVLEHMRQDPVLSKVKVLVITNLTLPEEAERAMKLGAEDYLVKSDNSLKSILERVKQYVG